MRYTDKKFKFYEIANYIQDGNSDFNIELCDEYGNNYLEDLSLEISCYKPAHLTLATNYDKDSEKGWDNYDNWKYPIDLIHKPICIEDFEVVCITVQDGCEGILVQVLDKGGKLSKELRDWYNLTLDTKQTSVYEVEDNHDN